MAQSLDLAEGVSPVAGPRGVRLMGEAIGLIDTIARLRALMNNQVAEVGLGDWTLISTWDAAMHALRLDAASAPAAMVIYDPRAWAVAGGVLIDVPGGRYSSPLDFGDVGFCERSRRDIGVTVLGAVRYDLGRPRRQPVHWPESWEDTKARLRSNGLGATIRLAPTPTGRLGWVGDLVRLSDADVMVRKFVTAPTTDEVSDLLLYSEHLPKF